MNSIGDKTIGFEDDPGNGGEDVSPEQRELGDDLGVEQDDDEINQEEHVGGADGSEIDELDAAIRVLEEVGAIKEEPLERPVATGAAVNPERFRNEQEAGKKQSM